MVNKILEKEFIRFVFVGIYNTFFGYVLYVIFLYLLNDINIAYTLAYIIAALKSFFLYSRIVFNTKASTMTYILFPLGYIVQYSVGIILINVFTVYMHIDEYISGFIVIPFTAVIAYGYNKFIFKNKHINKNIKDINEKKLL